MSRNGESGGSIGSRKSSTCGSCDVRIGIAVPCWSCYRRHLAPVVRLGHDWPIAILVCIEYALPANEQAPGWEGHLVDLDDDGEDEVAFYCPDCAGREFGERLSLADS